MERINTERSRITPQEFEVLGDGIKLLRTMVKIQKLRPYLVEGDKFNKTVDKFAGNVADYYISLAGKALGHK